MTHIKGFSIYALAAICFLASFAAAEELTLNINVKKPIAVVSEKFLSITLDPIALFNTDFLSDAEKSINMARALAPAYVRIGGPRSNSYVFERGLYPQETHPDPGLTFTETHWINLHQWAERSGLDVVACIAPQMSEGARAWDPRNALDLISFSDHMGYNTSWQLGYECQTNCKMSGADLGRDVARLRNMLDAFPRFAETGLVAGPDVIAWRTKQEQQYLQDYFNAAAAALSAVTWHPDFAGVSLEEDGVSMHYDNLAIEKDALYKVAGRQIAKKPLWIAESKPEDCKRQFLGALVWARRLGNSAKLGAQVLMRQPENSNFVRPTPDFWVSMLHKMLVGREVLDTKIATGNRTHVHFYAQCTRPSSKYEKGSVTIFGLNLTPTKVAATLKGLKTKTVHKYVLLPGYDSPNRMFAETVLLNNDLLSLINGKEMPEINPVMYNVDKDIKLKLPSGGIGFWVLPSLKIKSCMGPEDDIAERNIVRKANKRLEDLELEEDLEPGADDSREVPDVADSLEDRRSLLRRQQQKRLPARRSVRHKEMDRDDERSLRKTEGTKRDVYRYERLGRKKEHSDNAESDVYMTSDEKDENFEEAIERKILDGQSADSGEEIRAKLYEYKRRLADHEYRKKQKATALTKEPDSTSNKNMETGKVIEALTLITKVENAMKGFEKNNDTQQRISFSPMVGSSDVSDVTYGLKKGSNSDGLLLDDVLNTEKAKRTAVPTKIEDQLKALYRLLSDEKDKKDGQIPMRHRRDLDKRVGDDPLGIRRDSIFLRKRTEAKERRNERRQRIRERLEEQRRERESIKKVPRDTSSENNFYGFQYRAPLKNFPEGDLYLQGTLPPIEEESTAKAKGAIDEHEDVWLEEGDGNYMPNEFYENVKLQKTNVKENLKEYGELWEAESLHKNEDNEKNVKEAVEHVTPEIVTERQLTDAEDRKAKEQAVQQLINYYEAVPQEHQQGYDFEELRQQRMQEHQQQQSPQVQQQQPLLQVQPQQVYYQPQVPINYEQAVAAGKYYAGPQGKFADANRYYVDPSQYPQQTRRSKRDISDLEDLLHQEMIDEDDNNLKDCQCRVIRGIDNCKDCQIQRERQSGTSVVLPGQIIQNPVIPYYGQRLRVRRDTEEVVPTIEVVVPEEIAVIPEGAPGIPEIIPETLEVDPEVPVETREEEIDEAIAPVALGDDAEPTGAVNIEVTMEASKEDGSPMIEAIAPEHEMNLEAEEDVPFGSRVARKTNSTAKFFRTKKKKISKTMPAPEKKTEASRQETNGFSENKTAKAESTTSNRPKDTDTNDPRSVDEKNTGAIATTAQSNNEHQPIITAFTGTANQSSLISFAGAANQPSLISFAGAANQPSITKFTKVASQPSIPKFTGVANQPSSNTFAIGTNQPPNTGYVNSNQTPATVFTGAANLPPTTGFANVAQQPLDTAFTGTAISAKFPADPVIESKDGYSAKAFDSVTVKTPGTTSDGKGRPDVKAAIPVSNGENKSNAETSASAGKRQNFANTESTDSEQTSGDQSASSPILNKPATTKGRAGTKTVVPLQPKKSAVLPKTNSTAKLDDLIKARHARLTTRTEALAALRKENENRRAKKMIEASLKLLESESARFAEYEKRRREQLDRLKDKLRAKREKMLHQYREELIEAINESEDQKKRTLRRRDLLDGYPRTDEDSEFVNYSPIIEMRSVPEDPNLRQSRSRSEGQYFISIDSDEYEETKNAKRSMSLDQPFEDEEEIYDTSASEFRSANFKRSPMVVVDYNNKNGKPQAMEGDSGEYYTPEQQEQLEERVREAQKRLQQQRQQQQLQVQKRREELKKLQEDLQKKEEQAKLQKQAAAQYPQIQQSYPPQLPQPYSSHMQQPYPPQVQQPYSQQVQQPYPPQPYLPAPHQLPHPTHQYPHSHHSSKNAMSLNVQYSRLPQAMYPQPPISVAQPANAQQQTDPKLLSPKTVIPQQQAFVQPQADPNHHAPQPATAHQPQPFAQQPNAAYYNQQFPIQSQLPGVNYYNQDPAIAMQQSGASYYNYLPVNGEQQPNVGYANQQAPVFQQQQQQQQQPMDTYYGHPAEQQYYYPPAPTEQQRPDAEYYKQLSATSQQPTNVNNNKNVESTPQTGTEVNSQAAVSQKSSSPQPPASHKQSGQQPTISKTGADQGRRTVATQQRPDVNLCEEKPVIAENLQDIKVYRPVLTAAESPLPFDTSNYYQFYRDLNQQESDVNQYEISPAAYEGIQQVSAPRGYKKSKRSNLKVLEINPSIYDDDDSDYNLHELFMKPSSRSSSRSYRSYPYDPTDSKRYRRGVSLEEKEDGPLSISLGLELSDMVPRDNNPAKSDASIRRKRQVQDMVSQGKSPVNKNIKKAYNEDKHKKTPKRLTLLRRIDDTVVTATIPKIRKLRVVDDSINYFSPVQVLSNNNLDENKDEDTDLMRPRRSLQPKNGNHLKYNHINRNEDSDMNEIWNDIIEMKQDEALDEYDRRKDELFSHFIQDQKPDVILTNDNKDSMIQKVSETTTKVNIESIIEEAIPKIGSVITGSIEKAQNLTGNLEEFIENFDEQFDETTEYVQETSAIPEDTNNGRLSHSVFKTMIGHVRKFFGFLSGITKIFHHKH